jgi:methylglutaconyl-CoA hydratase
MTYNTLLIEQKGSVLFCKLNRPDVRNAFNAEMISELTGLARTVDSNVRAVVLKGEGPLFCAGGDLRWM